MKYISAPYGSAENKEERMKVITSHSANCLKRDESIICPLTMGHEFIKHCELPYDSEWWLKWCFDLLKLCDEMDVLCISGWESSVGVSAEKKFAKEYNIKINVINV